MTQGAPEQNPDRGRNKARAARAALQIFRDRDYFHWAVLVGFLCSTSYMHSLLNWSSDKKSQ